MSKESGAGLADDAIDRNGLEWVEVRSDKGGSRERASWSDTGIAERVSEEDVGTACSWLFEFS